MHRCLLGLLLVGLGIVSACDAPTEPAASRAVYEALLARPALTRGAERDSSFAAGFWPYRIYTGFAKRGGRVARSAETWTPLFDTLQLFRIPKRPPLAVDFTQEMVVLALYGGASSGGHVVRIRHVTLARDTLFVLAERIAPGASCVVTAAVTAAADARVIPALGAPVIVLFAPYVHDCDTERDRPAW